MTTIIARPTFSTLFKRQVEQTPLDRNIGNMVAFSADLDLHGVGGLVKSLASLGRNAYMPHLVTLLDRNDAVWWMVVGSNAGWVAVSEEGALKWSEVYQTRLMKYFKDRDLKEVEYLTITAMVCGLPLQPLMNNIMRCDVEPRWMYTGIIEPMSLATQVIGGGRLCYEFNYGG